MKDANKDVFSKIETAKGLYDRFAQALREIPDFCILLEDYRKEIGQSRCMMEELGLPEICSHCAVFVPGGGCCGTEIATWYDPFTLLINLFWGIDFPTRPYYKDSCLFLAKDGCMLMARYHFCVNYLCHRITSVLSEEDLAKLTSQSGRELYIGWRLEVFLEEFFHSRGVSVGIMG